MALVSMTAEFDISVDKLWEIVTNLERTQWRRDISKVVIVNENEFIEYTNDGFATDFKVTHRIPGKCWEFDMENINMKGHWTGYFRGKENKCEIEFIEDVAVESAFLRLFAKAFLKKQQRAYVADLKREVDRQLSVNASNE